MLRRATIQPDDYRRGYDHRDDDRVGVRPVPELPVNESESQEQQNCSQSDHDEHSRAALFRLWRLVRVLRHHHAASPRVRGCRKQNLLAQASPANRTSPLRLPAAADIACLH